VSKLGRKTPTRASELMDIATKFASGQEAVEAIFRKDKQPQGRQPEDVPCDGTSQVIRPTYSCPCLTDIRHPVDVPKSLDKFGIFPYLTRNVSPVLQTLQNIGDKEMRKLLHKLTFI
jgi:hypothetical protein